MRFCLHVASTLIPHYSSTIGCFHAHDLLTLTFTPCPRIFFSTVVCHFLVSLLAARFLLDAIRPIVSLGVLCVLGLVFTNLVTKLTTKHAV
jgi:hypothetical protein